MKKNIYLYVILVLLVQTSTAFCEIFFDKIYGKTKSEILEIYPDSVDTDLIKYGKYNGYDYYVFINYNDNDYVSGVTILTKNRIDYTKYDALEDSQKIFGIDASNNIKYKSHEGNLLVGLGNGYICEIREPSDELSYYQTIYGKFSESEYKIIMDSLPDYQVEKQLNSSFDNNLKTSYNFDAIETYIGITKKDATLICPQMNFIEGLNLYTVDRKDIGNSHIVLCLKFDNYDIVQSFSVLFDEEYKNNVNSNSKGLSAAYDIGTDMIGVNKKNLLKKYDYYDNMISGIYAGDILCTATDIHEDENSPLYYVDCSYSEGRTQIFAATTGFYSVSAAIGEFRNAPIIQTVVTNKCKISLSEIKYPENDLFAIENDLIAIFIVENISEEPIGISPLFFQAENRKGDVLDLDWKKSDLEHNSIDPGEKVRGRLYFHNAGNRPITIKYSEGLFSEIYTFKIK